MYFVVRWSSCRSIILREEELAFFNAISTLHLSPAILKWLRKDLFRRKKKAAMLAGSHSTAPGGGAGAPQRPSGQFAGKRNANELASSGGSSEHANTFPGPSEGSATLPDSHGRTSCVLKPRTRSARGRVDVRGCLSLARRPVSDKSVAQTHSHGFRPV